MKNSLRRWYVNFLENEKRNFFEQLFFYLLLLLSFIYGAVVHLRNFLYNSGIKKSHSASGKVISVGNISWGGCGKTTFARYLYHKLQKYGRVAILRRGYGLDEGALLKESDISVYSGPNRISLAQSLKGNFDFFILDDGFQHRALLRDVDIVIMTGREFNLPQRLIPASIFREPLSSLKRADILIVNYKEEILDSTDLREKLQRLFTNLKIYFSSYKITRFCDLNNNPVTLEKLKEEKAAVFTAIGYPGGFLNLLKKYGITATRQFIYPDHYELTEDEFRQIAGILENDGIRTILITHKDKFHLPPDALGRFNVIITEIEIEIENETDLLKTINDKLCIKLQN
ncbi:MAG: tetraacyldisaccharide 4'-kinase [Candidatus Omnitrophica bacterium]|nr:tetraacyldisaccharide 4'-kinase [Candidatus Omnitrophota bacterium]